VKLADERERFEARGLGLAALSYDSVALLKDFAERRRISYPLLSDPDSEIIRRFGLLHPAYPEGHDWHGLPYPTTLVVDAAGVVRARFVEEEGYEPRPTPASLFVHAGEAGVGGRTARNHYFEVRSATSDAEVHPGNRVSLVLDIALAPGHHAYAPGAASYRTLNLSIEPHPLVSAGELTLPESRPYHFEPLDETVPVFDGEFRVIRDLLVATGKQIGALATSEDPIIRLRGSLEYQVCSDRVCYPPGQLPLEWSLRVVPLDFERVPEGLRRKR
jgi:hypothetical protein